MSASLWGCFSKWKYSSLHIQQISNEPPCSKGHTSHFYLQRAIRRLRWNSYGLLPSFSWWCSPNASGKRLGTTLCRRGDRPISKNQGWYEDGGNYHRFPNRVKDLVREKEWELSCQSVGLSIHFKTNAQDISVRYEVTQPLNMPHMPSTGVSGVDLYCYEDMAFCFGIYSFRDTIQYQYRVDRGV